MEVKSCSPAFNFKNEIRVEVGCACDPQKYTNYSEAPRSRILTNGGLTLRCISFSICTQVLSLRFFFLVPASRPAAHSLEELGYLGVILRHSLVSQRNHIILTIRGIPKSCLVSSLTYPFFHGALPLYRILYTASLTPPPPPPRTVAPEAIRRHVLCQTAYGC